MKKMLLIVCMLSLAFAPAGLLAQEASVKPIDLNIVKPVQVLQDGQINTTLAEAANVDWSTGKGRKDGILKWAVDDNYLYKSTGMLLRGASNAGFGWAEIFTHPFRWSKNAPLGIGTVVGLIIGPAMAVLRTASGAIDVATFWVPLWHGVPMAKPALGLNDVHYYGAIEDVDQYKHETHRYGFNKLSDEY